MAAEFHLAHQVQFIGTQLLLSNVVLCEWEGESWLIKTCCGKLEWELWIMEANCLPCDIGEEVQVPMLAIKKIEKK